MANRVLTEEELARKQAERDIGIVRAQNAVRDPYAGPSFNDYGGFARTDTGPYAGRVTVLNPDGTSVTNFPRAPVVDRPNEQRVNQVIGQLQAQNDQTNRIAASRNLMQETQPGRNVTLDAQQRAGIGAPLERRTALIAGDLARTDRIEQAGLGRENQLAMERGRGVEVAQATATGVIGAQNAAGEWDFKKAGVTAPASIEAARVQGEEAARVTGASNVEQTRVLAETRAKEEALAFQRDLTKMVTAGNISKDMQLSLEAEKNKGGRVTMSPYGDVITILREDGTGSIYTKGDPEKGEPEYIERKIGSTPTPSGASADATDANANGIPDKIEAGMTQQDISAYRAAQAALKKYKDISEAPPALQKTVKFFKSQGLAF